MLLRFTPASDAREDSEELVRETISGASLESTVYSLGMLNATTSPAAPAMQHHLNMVFQFLRSLRRSSMRSISSYCSSWTGAEDACLFLFSSISENLSERYQGLSRLTSIATVLVSDEATDAVLSTSEAVTGLRSGRLGTTIVHPGWTLALAKPLLAALPFIYMTYALDFFAV